MYFKEKKAGTAKYGTRLLWGEEPGHECEQHSTLDSVTCENSGIAALIGELRRVLVKEGTSFPARLDDFANVADDAQNYHPAPISYIRGNGVWELKLAWRMQRSLHVVTGTVTSSLIGIKQRTDKEEGW